MLTVLTIEIGIHGGGVIEVMNDRLRFVNGLDTEG